MNLTILIGLILCVARVWIGFTVTPESFHWVQAYKDAAHLFMGGLTVALYRDRKPWQKVLFWSMCALEVIVAVASRVGI